MNFKICSACGKDIVFLETKTKRRMPVNADTVRAGDELYDPSRHKSHFSTCTRPADFRGPKPAAPPSTLTTSDKQQLVVEWKALANEFPGVRQKQTLRSGLMLVFHLQDGRYHLAFGRKGVYPAGNEITPWLRAFDAPLHVRQTNDTAGEAMILRVNWPAPAQVPLPIEGGEEVMPADEMELS